MNPALILLILQAAPPLLAAISAAINAGKAAGAAPSTATPDEIAALAVAAANATAAYNQYLADLATA